jgi:hypothetical protein
VEVGTLQIQDTRVFDLLDEIEHDDAHQTSDQAHY